MTTDATTDTLLLTATEAAARLGVSRRTMYRLIRDRGMPTVSIGKELRVPAAALAGWVAAQAAVAREPHPGQVHDPVPTPYLVGTRAYVAKVCRLCGLMLDDGRPPAK